MHLAALASLALLALAPPGRPAPRIEPSTVAAVREYLGRAAGAGFSGSVLLAHGERVLLSQGFGSLSCDRRAPVLPSTPFYLASLSKAFTAAAVLRLEAEGRLRVSDSIARYLPGVPADKRGITIHHLLTHTSGLAASPEADTAHRRDDFVRAVLAPPLRAAPGAEYRYSNDGYSLLAAIVERASARPFAVYLRDAVLRPAGLERTALVTEPARWPAASLARACNAGLDQGDALVSHHRPYAWSELGAVGVVSTAPDLFRWVRALRSGKLLSPAAAARMFTPGKEGYGYGWQIATLPSGRRLISHTGLLLPEGWNTQIRVWPEDDLTLVVLSNGYAEDATGWIVARAVSSILFGGDVAYPPRAQADGGTGAEDLAGRYTLEGGELRVRPAGEGLALEAEGQAAVDALLGVAPDAAKRLREADERAGVYLEHLLRGDLAGLDSAAMGRPSAEWLPRVQSTWSWLRERFGAPLRGAVLHSVPASFGDDAALTYLRLDFERGSTSVRLIWAGGAFQGMSDRGAFTGATLAIPPLPGPLPLIPLAPRAFAAFRFATGEHVDVRFAPGADGCMELRLRGERGEVVARRASPCTPP